MLICIGKNLLELACALGFPCHHIRPTIYMSPKVSLRKHTCCTTFQGISAEDPQIESHREVMPLSPPSCSPMQLRSHIASFSLCHFHPLCHVTGPTIYFIKAVMLRSVTCHECWWKTLKKPLSYITTRELESSHSSCSSPKFWMRKSALLTIFSQEIDFNHALNLLIGQLSS